MVRRFQPPESMKVVPKDDADPYIKARHHHMQADAMARPHEVFLERWRGFEFLYRDLAPQTEKHDAVIFAREAGEVDFIIACLMQLSRPRIDGILGLPAIGDLNVVLSRHNTHELIDRNEMLQEAGISSKVWLESRKDLRFALKANPVKGLRGVATQLFVVRAASDPKVRKQDNLVRDVAALEPANSLLKDCVTHMVEHFKRRNDRFFEPAFRKPMLKV